MWCYLINKNNVLHFDIFIEIDKVVTHIHHPNFETLEIAHLLYSFIENYILYCKNYLFNDG